MNIDFEFYNCHFKGQKVSVGESEFVGKKMVLKRILEADRLDGSFHLVNPLNNTHYIHFYAKDPWDGLYLLDVVNTSTRSSLFVLFDTRIFPNFILVEKNLQNPEESLEVAMVVEYSLFLAARKYGWEARLMENNLNEIRYVDKFISAMEYVENIEHSASRLSLIFHQPQVSQLIMDNHGSISNI